MIERYELPVRLTANQNLILTAIDPSWKADILATLTAAGVKCAPCLRQHCWGQSTIIRCYRLWRPFCVTAMLCLH